MKSVEMVAVLALCVVMVSSFHLNQIPGEKRCQSVGGDAGTASASTAETVISSSPSLWGLVALS